MAYDDGIRQRCHIMIHRRMALVLALVCSGCVYHAPPGEMASDAPPDLPSDAGRTIVVMGAGPEAEHLRSTLAATGFFAGVHLDNWTRDGEVLGHRSEDDTAPDNELEVQPVAMPPIIGVLGDQPPFLLLFLGFVPIWESHERGVAFETIGDPSVRVTCSWPEQMWVGWLTVPLALSPHWSLGRDREAFVEAMRRCVAAQWRLSGGAEG
jgi:hypothetical protein